MRDAPAAALTPFALGLAPAALAAANGGYFPTSWGWASLGFAWAAAIGVVAIGRPLGRGLAFLAPLVALDLFSFASAAWSPVRSSSFTSGEQTLVLVIGSLAFLTAIRHEAVRHAALGLVTGASLVSAYALATRLLPGHVLGASIAGNRLYRPVGYWNGLGIYAVIAILVLVGLLPRSGLVQRAVLAFALPFLAATAYFTYSRGAAIACTAGLVALFALSPNRVQWLLRTASLAVPAAAGVALASSSSALTTVGARTSDVSSQGHRLALVLVALGILSALLGAIPTTLYTVRHRTERAATIVVSAALVCAVVGGLVAVGGPAGIWDKFKAPPPQTHGQLNKRLFSFSGSARTPLWSAAVHEYKAHPALGGGAGSYESYYLRHRADASKVRNAHNLYLETLAELGPLGLVLLLAALLAPLVYAVRARREPVVPALAAAYLAFLVHLLVDWDWQLTGVALTALACGALIFVASDPDENVAASTERNVLLGVCAVAIVAAFFVLTANLDLSRSTTAARAGDWAASARRAKAAETWAPWSSEPLRLLGEAQLGEGDRRAAAATFRRAISKSRDDWNLWFDLARASLGAEQHRALTTAARLNPRSPEIAELRRELAAQTTIVVTGGA